jgi:hypothetical protein
MDLMVNIDLKKLPVPIRYPEKLFLMGSCFTENIGNALSELKFPVIQNPNGILFDPASVSKSLISYIQNKKYAGDELFQLNEVWNSWAHHSRFSHIEKEACLLAINQSQQKAHDFIKEADWLVITLGSSFSYRLVEPDYGKTGTGAVANCHRAPAKWFIKHLMAIDEIIADLDNSLQQLFEFNEKLKVIFTISPVRHIRDGVIENNRSKARLIESVHQLVNKYEQVHYFPAYELIVDVLRDYRFYDVDLVHPNYAATEFVLNRFKEYCIDDDSQSLMQELKKISIARKHKAFQPLTNAHLQFLKTHLEKVKVLQTQYPFLVLDDELSYFSESN